MFGIFLYLCWMIYVQITSEYQRVRLLQYTAASTIEYAPKCIMAVRRVELAFDDKILMPSSSSSSMSVEKPIFY